MYGCHSIYVHINKSLELLPPLSFIHIQVWFRRGVNSHNPCGSGWISMVGEMFMINVGLNDQVIFLCQPARKAEAMLVFLQVTQFAAPCRCWPSAVRTGQCTSARVWPPVNSAGKPGRPSVCHEMEIDPTPVPAQEAIRGRYVPVQCFKAVFLQWGSVDPEWSLV